MTGMTPERLASIRERLDLYGGLDPLDTADLLDEVLRLRLALNAIRNGCDTLLDPTEGETQ